MSRLSPAAAMALFGTESPTPEQIEEHNARVTAKLDANLDRFVREEQDAIRALRDSASASSSTALVKLPGGVELEVRTRVPPSVEALQERLEAADGAGRIAEMKDLACEMLAAMVVSPKGFGNPEVWAVAASQEDAGAVWLLECADAVLGPMKEKAERMRGESEASAGTLKGRRAKPSGA